MGLFFSSGIADEQRVRVAYELAGDCDVDGSLLLVSSDHPHLHPNYISAVSVVILLRASETQHQCSCGSAAAAAPTGAHEPLPAGASAADEQQVWCAHELAGDGNVDYRLCLSFYIKLTCTVDASSNLLFPENGTADEQ